MENSPIFKHSDVSLTNDGSERHMLLSKNSSSVLHTKAMEDIINSKGSAWSLVQLVRLFPTHSPNVVVKLQSDEISSGVTLGI